MNKIALLYQSREGQTLKIANSILASLVHWGYEVSMFDLNGDMQAFNACDFDAFLLDVPKLAELTQRLGESRA